ncbi:D-aminoacyl-tRNA deacylase [Serpentinicella sp. ANB-PHB4]|uniref:D-aminoacyl-tRNA deacylase n=1 Tax=Serpentinicella sp. ANB-PHB4 TaxID=3074076 RepID=UPI0028655C30|nr:D-aminoacyl-tRNA deacylase [Serpentinicella sp. ANB-PHB4]MDR5658070.1 D-aminoacyl-tRNA deacylase [Serpentinicella sp. ANB-PHB4]
MRAVVQRISQGKVEVDHKVTGQIHKGLLVYLGISEEDTIDDIKYMIEKITNLRIFEDDDEKLNLSVKDVGGKLLIVSQFTLMGDCRKGRRPNFSNAAKPEFAKKLYNLFIEACQKVGIEVQTGVFQAHMMVHSTNDGPVTIMIDSKKTF